MWGRNNGTGNDVIYPLREISLRSDTDCHEHWHAYAEAEGSLFCCTFMQRSDETASCAGPIDQPANTNLHWRKSVRVEYVVAEKHVVDSVVVPSAPLEAKHLRAITNWQ